MIFDDSQERLNRFYYSSELDRKLQKLTEYYKFHSEVPRIFMLPLMKVMNNFHNDKRKINYYKVFNRILD
jgi:hypothetical protein